MKTFWDNGGKSWVMAVLTGILAWGIAWGTVRNQVEIDKCRIDAVEKTNQEILQRLSTIEGKLDLIIREKYR